MKHNNKSVNYRDYMLLLSRNYQRIYSFILMLVPNHNDADDIMQQTSIVMYEKFNSFESGSNFLAWARVTAKYQVLNFLKKKQRERVVFDQKVIDLVDMEARECIRRQDEWVDVLRKCVSQLPDVDRQLLKNRYHEDTGIKVIAQRVGCSFQRIYRDLARIHDLLLRCVRRKMAMGDL